MRALPPPVYALLASVIALLVLMLVANEKVSTGGANADRWVRVFVGCFVLGTYVLLPVCVVISLVVWR